MQKADPVTGTPAMIDRDLSNGGPLLWLVVAVGTLITIAFFYPGYLNGDSDWQYHQGLSGEYNDMHPVIMSWIWRYLDRVIEGSGGLYLLTTFLFWTGLAMFTRSFSGRTSIFVAATFLIGLSHPVFSMLSQIHKDVGMVTGLLLGYVLLLRSDRRRSLWLLLLALPAFWYAVAVRHNGAAAVVPFTVWMSHLLVRDHLPSRLGRHLAGLPRTLILGTLIAVAMILASGFATRAILGQKGVHYPYLQFVVAHDLLGIAARTGKNFFPKGIYYESPLRLEELRELYNPYTVYFAYWGDPGPRRLMVETQRPSVIAALESAWVDALRSEPVAYAKHRMVLFLAHLGVGEYAPIRKLEFAVARKVAGKVQLIYDYKGPTVFGMPHNRWLTRRYAAAGGMTLRPTGIVFRPWPYLLLSFVCVAVAWSWRSPHLFHIALLGASSIAYVGPHLVIGVAAELRYMWWPILVSLLQPIILLDGVLARSGGIQDSDTPPPLAVR